MDAAGFLRLIAEPTRFAILEQLRLGERGVAELIVTLGAEQSNLSHHLRSLRNAGLVQARAIGRERRYRLADPEIRRLLEQVEGLAGRLEKVAFYTGLELPYNPGFHGYG
jgi:DNA-binding transcriptional ArsR family regulator